MIPHILGVEAVAIKRYQAGEKLNFSTGIDDLTTYGYGKLDDYGFWEFPLPFAYLREDHKKLVIALISNRLDTL